MNSILKPNEHLEKDQQNNQFSDNGLYVREDDQDWGSAGMDNIKQEFDSSQ